MEMHDQVLICHGRIHDTDIPWYLNESVKIKFGKKGSTMIDIDKYALPDVEADLRNKRQAVKAVPSGSVSTVISMYCSYPVFGTWDKPNASLFLAASEWLKPRGVIIVAIAHNGMFPDDHLNSQYDDLLSGFAKRLPTDRLAELKKSKHGGVRELWPIIFAMKDAKSASSRSRIKKMILERFPELHGACDWLEKEVANQLEHSSDEIAKKRIDAFASHVQRITHGKLKRASRSTHIKYLSKEGLTDHGTIVFIKS
jgi:hypothetical protein